MDVTENGIAPTPGLTALFGAFAKGGLLGFGGANAVVRRVVVEERRWVSERDYAEMLGLAQVLPGPNVGNVAVMLGRRFHGLPGTLAAMGGLYLGPLLVLLTLTLLWERFGANPAVAPAMRGVAAAAAGMIVGTGLRMTTRLRPPPELLLLTGLAAAAGAWLRLPLPLIVLTLGPLGVAAVAWRARRVARRGD